MKIKVSEDFSKTPGHRSPDDGVFSGEQFLEEVLRPAYVKARGAGENLIVDLDHTSGYATSFLEASFGGLAREYPISEVESSVVVVCTSEPYLIDEVAGYIREARKPRGLRAFAEKIFSPS